MTFARTTAEGGRFDGITDLTRLTNGDVMCCLCFEYTPRDLLWRDGRGTWDMCQPCGDRMGPTVIARTWSFSALEDYSCGQKFYLRRVAKVPRIVYFNAVAGTAFHKWTEDYDRVARGSGLFELEWPHYLDEAIRTERDGTPLEQMRISGRKTTATPNKEDYTHWRDVLGPDLCVKYITWSADKTIAHDLPPDPSGNTLGIEYEVLFTIGNTKVRGFIDRIYEYDGNNLLIVDMKAGARKQTTVQLPTYVLGARKAGINAKYGSIYYARKGTHTNPQDYSRWDEHRMSFLYEQAAAMEAAGFYLPRPSEDCGWCSVRDHCQFALR